MKTYITSNPEVLGGELVIVGTRIPVKRILHLLRDGYTIEAIHQDYPHIDIKTLERAIDEAIETIDKQRNAPRI